MEGGGDYGKSMMILGFGFKYDLGMGLIWRYIIISG
jgi:hypothetical protein